MELEIEWLRDLLLLQVAGQLSLITLMRLRAVAYGEWSTKPTRALVFDLRAAIIVMTPYEEQLSSEVSRRWWHGMAPPPAAVVVDPGMLAWSRAEDVRFASRGLIRHTFTNRIDALSWAASRREMRHCRR